MRASSSGARDADEVVGGHPVWAPRCSRTVIFLLKESEQEYVRAALGGVTL